MHPRLNYRHVQLIQLQQREEAAHRRRANRLRRELRRAMPPIMNLGRKSPQSGRFQPRLADVGG